MATPSPSLAAPSASPLPDLLEALNNSFASLGSLLEKVPGSQIAWRYFKASHQDDPFRTVLEILLVFFIVRTYAQSRTKGDASGRNFVKLSEKVSALIADGSSAWTCGRLQRVPSSARSSSETRSLTFVLSLVRKSTNWYTNGDPSHCSLQRLRIKFTLPSSSAQPDLVLASSSPRPVRTLTILSIRCSSRGARSLSIWPAPTLLGSPAMRGSRRRPWSA